jgi:hypothetical protein
VVILASAFFASFISPQINMKGRGLRLSLFLLILFIGFVFLVKPKAFLVLIKYKITLFFGSLYVFTGIVRYLIYPNKILFQNHIIAALVCFIIWLIILIIRKEFGDSVENIRWMTLLSLGVSLGIGIPVLLSQPQIARLTMGNPLEDYYASILFPKGVANYSWYTPVGITFPVIANWLYRTKKGFIAKIIGWILLLAASLATILSSFMMAILLLMAGAFIWLSIVMLKGKNWGYKIVAMAIILISIISIPTVMILGVDFGPTKFVVSKVSRFLEGIADYGLFAADETGRVEMLLGSIHTFLQSPIFGGWGIMTNFYIGGHSSWGDILGSQGMIGFFLWLGFLGFTIKRKEGWFSVENGNAGAIISWNLLFIGGVLNPTFHSAIALLLLWLFDECPSWARPECISKER